MISNEEYQDRLAHLITEALNEDVGDGDHSTLSSIPAGQKGKAVLKIKQDGVLAGVEVAQKIFRQVEPAAEFFLEKQDGEEMHNGEVAFRVHARIHTILTCERLVLNCMQRMSGIATLTKQYTRLLEGFHTRLLDTRKTTPNFRLLEKEAVRIGGAVNHRFGLFDMIMLKDNHIDYAGGIIEAVNRAWEYVQTKKPDLKIEVETRSLEDVELLMAHARGKVFRVMLDNYDPPTIMRALEMIDGAFETEASGGINLENIREYAATGVDFVSSGALIHQARSLDLSLKAELD